MSADILRFVETLPVNRAMLPVSPPNLMSLGMKDLRLAFRHNVGCLSSLKSTQAAFPSTKTGLQEGSPIAFEALAKQNRQSSSANTLTARNQIDLSVSNSAKRRNLKALMAALRFSRASFRARTVGCIEPTSQRVLFYRKTFSVIHTRSWYCVL